MFFLLSKTSLFLILDSLGEGEGELSYKSDRVIVILKETPERYQAAEELQQWCFFCVKHHKR